jgi:branched-chain amino acid transport system permease protein
VSVRREAVIVAIGLCLALVPVVFGSYWTGLLTQALIFAGFALGLDLMVGYAGLPTLGHGAFFGLSGYGTAIAIIRWDVNPWPAALFGIAVSAGVAAVFAPLAVRVRGLAFLTVMLAFGQVAWGLATRGGHFTGGENGIPGVPRPSLTLGSFDLRGIDDFYLFTLLCTTLVTLLLARCAGSSVGASLIGLRDNAPRMEALGYDVRLRRVVAFAVAGAAGAFYGVLSVFFNGFVGPSALDWRLSAQMLLSVVIGGAGSLWGPFVAGGGLHILRTYITGETDRWPMVLGALYVTAVLALPGGIASIPTLLRLAGPAMRGWRAGVSRP